MPARSQNNELNQALNIEENCNVAAEPNETPALPTQSPEENKEAGKTERASLVGRE